MFWSVVIQPNKKIPLNQTTMIHLTNACIKVKGKVDPTKRANFYIETGCGKILLCSLIPGVREHQLLDFVFVEGEEVTFNNESSYPLHLSGYVVVDLIDPTTTELPDIVQEEEDDDENWIENGLPDDDEYGEPEIFIEDPMDIEEEDNLQEIMEENVKEEEKDSNDNEQEETDKIVRIHRIGTIQSKLNKKAELKPKKPNQEEKLD